MKTQKHILMLLAGMLILALVAAGCQSSKKAEGPPDGEYSKSGYLLTLEQGHFKLRDLEEGSYTIDGDKITFNTEKTLFESDDNCSKVTVYTYQWGFDTDAGLLTFKPVDDPCSFRQDVNTLGHWAYSKLSK